MDLLIAIKEEQAFICNLPVVEGPDKIVERLELERADSMEEVFSFKRGDTVIDDNNNTHVVADIVAPAQYAAPAEWYITTPSGDKVNILSLKGTVIKEVPKYYVDGLLAS